MSFERPRKYKSMGRSLMLLPLGVALIACGSSGGKGDSPYTELFDTVPNATATPDVLTGLWGGSKTDSSADAVIDIRVDIRDNALTEAARCTFGDGTVIFAGVDVEIRTDATTLTILEGKEDRQVKGIYSCHARVTPGEAGYNVDGLNLNLFNSTFMKIRD